jgi:hypothetical protein
MRDWDSSPGEIVFQHEVVPPGFWDNAPNSVRIKILHADPVVIANRSFLEEILTQDSPWVELQGEFIKFIGHNRTVIYRIGEYNFMYDAYMLRWPD